MKLCRILRPRFLPAVALLLPGAALGQVQAAGPAPPTHLRVSDHPFDGGETLDVEWDPSADDGTRVSGYRVYRSMTQSEIAAEDADQRAKLISAAKEQATADARAASEAEGLGPPETEARIRAARLEAAARAAEEAAEKTRARMGEARFKYVADVDPGVTRLTVGNLDRHESYVFRVQALARDGSASATITAAAPASPRLQWFDGSRFFLLIITIVFCGSVVYWIQRARRGRELNVRKIAGLEAVDEAVGRATEMGRSCLYVPGIQDMNEMQTIASMTVLARVARTAAEHHAKVEVPTSKALVMTTARETLQAAFLSAGRPDAYSEDLAYYVTDEQFGYVAYLSGLMVREKPAACFYMGAFFAESLILAETGNSIGAIQVAGTAMPAQLPFFVAACDYTLIGEEFFAASAYLSGSPEELGSLKGQDVGKVIVGAVVAISVILATIAAITGSTALASLVDYIKHTILT